MLKRTLTALLIGLLASGAMYYVWCSLQWRRAAMQSPTTTERVMTPPPVAEAGPDWFFVRPGNVEIDARLERHLMVFGQPGNTHVLLTARAGDVAPTWSRVPASVVLVLDRSGSMAGDRIVQAKAAARYLLSQLIDGDRVAIVSYADTTRLELGSTLLGPSNRWLVEQAIENVAVGGGTCISCGLEASQREVMVGIADGYAQRVIVLSDGQANQGVVHTPGLTALARKLEEAGATVSTIGVGLDYNEELLSQLAVSGNGNHYFVEHATALAQILGDEVSSLKGLVARRLVATFELADGVRFVKGYERAFAVSGRHVTVSLGDLGPHEEATVLFELATVAANGVQPVLTASVTFEDLATGKPALVVGSLQLGTTTDAAAAVASLDPSVAVRVEQARLNEALAKATEQMKAGDVDGATRILRTQAASSRKGYDTFGDEGFIGQVEMMDTLAGEFAAAGSAAPAERERAAKKAAVQMRDLAR